MSDLIDFVMRLRSDASTLDAAVRHGTDVDEPEGSRFIMLSDTLAKELSLLFVAIADAITEKVQ